MMASSHVPLTERCDALTSMGISDFGVGFLIPFLDETEFEVAVQRARVVESFWGLPGPQRVARAKSAGALVSWQVGSATEARAALDAGCDIIVAQGVEAGGHVRATLPMLAVLASVLDVVDGRAVVLAAGGISSARAMAAVLAGGADGVRVGTRFVAARKSDAHPAYRQALVDAGGGRHTLLTTSYGQDSDWPDAPHRVLTSAYAAATASTEGERVAEWRRDGTGEAQPVGRFETAPPSRDHSGSVEAMAVYAGPSVADVTGVQGAADIVQGLTEAPGP